jgi:hypothetical protein
MKLRPGFNTDIANRVISDVQTRRSNLYYFVGKIEKWNPVDDLSGIETQEISSEENDNIIRSNMLYVKKVVPNDVSLVVKRYDWVAGLKWSMWDDSLDMTSDGDYNDFYCMSITSDPSNKRYLVYKCLDNGSSNVNKTLANVSTVNPADIVGTRTTPVRTTDGYLWKFMYEVQQFKYDRFASSDYIPVQRSLHDSFYSNGGLDSVTVIESGSGYSGEDLTTLDFVGTTTGSGCLLSVDSLSPVGGIETSGISIVSGGSGYTKGAKVRVKQRYDTLGQPIVTGSGFSGYIDSNFAVGGVVTSASIVVTNSGYSYNTDDELEVVVGGVFAKPVLNSTGGIVEVRIIDPGYGYTEITECIASSYDVTGAPIGTGIYGNPSAVLLPVVHNGQLKNVSIVDPGKDYGVSLDTIVVVTGTGTGAIVTPVVDGGMVVDAYISEPGYGYTSSNLRVVGDGTGAVIEAVISGSDFSSEQSIVEQTAVDGGIHAVVVKNPAANNGYVAGETFISVIGDGTGCVVEPIIVNGSIISVKVLSPGVGYTSSRLAVKVEISTINRTGPGLVDAELDVVFSPLGGHGYNAISELYAKTLCINSYLKSDAIVNSIGQEFRQFGLLRDPKTAFTQQLFRGDSELVAYSVEMSNTTDLLQDETLVNANGSIFRVVYKKDNVVLLQPNNIKRDAPVGQLYVADQPSRVYDVTRINSSPTVNKYSGGLLYVSNEKPFVFNAEQSIVIKTFIEF